MNSLVRLPFSVRSFIRIVAVLGAFWLAAPGRAARHDRPPEAATPAQVKPGTTGLLKQAASGMRYFLRVPKKYDAAKGARLLVFLHGSSMNGLDYLRSFEAKKWGEDDLLCCPNGENGTDPFGQNNFGFESAPLIAGVMEEVQKAFKTTVSYVGGHSQGAFVTYSLILNHPQLCQGAFPMAGDCWMQNEPNLWEDQPEVLARQREIPIAVIHGKADPVVAFSQGQHAYDCFRAMGWTKLRLFAPDRLNHMFMLAPVDEALEWLDAMNGLNEKKSLPLAAKWAKAGEWAWAMHAAQAPPSGNGSSSALQKSAEAAAAKAVPLMTAAMKGKPADWVPQWMEFQRIFGTTQAAAPLIAAYLETRRGQRPKAGQLFRQWQSLNQAQKSEAARKVLEELRDTAPNTYWGFFAVNWLAAPEKE